MTVLQLNTSLLFCILLQISYYLYHSMEKALFPIIFRVNYKPDGLDSLERLP
jgi:hypothetical protein